MNTRKGASGMSHSNTRNEMQSPDGFMHRITPHLSAVSAMIRFRIPWRDDWDDVLQNTLLCAWRSQAERRDEQALKPWLMKICGNCCHMHMRSTLRRETGRAGYRDASEREQAAGRSRFIAMGRSRGDVTADARIELERLLAHLPETERRMMVDYYFKGLRVAEIAAREHRPEGTVKRWLHSGRQRMRTMMEQDTAPGEGNTHERGE